MRYAKRDLRNPFMPLLRRVERQQNKQSESTTPEEQDLDFNVLGFSEPVEITTNPKRVSRFDLLNRRRSR